MILRAPKDTDPVKYVSQLGLYDLDFLGTCRKVP